MPLMASGACRMGGGWNTVPRRALIERFMTCAWDAFQCVGVADIPGSAADNRLGHCVESPNGLDRDASNLAIWRTTLGLLSTLCNCPGRSTSVPADLPCLFCGSPSHPHALFGKMVNRCVGISHILVRTISGRFILLDRRCPCPPPCDGPG
jgi:hypothetical protein